MKSLKSNVWDLVDQVLDDKSNQSIADDDSDSDDSKEIPPPIANLANFTPTTTIPSNKIPITKTGAFIPFDALQIPRPSDLAIHKAVRKIENYFTLKTMLFTGNFKQSKRCAVDKVKRRIIVPRFGVFEILDKKYGLQNYTTKSQLSAGLDIDYRLSSSVKPTHNQQLVLDYIMQEIFTADRVIRGSAGTVLNLEAGQGKTFVAIFLMNMLKKKTAIILHSTVMLKQWTDAFALCFPNLTIGFYYGEKKIQGDIMIMIIDSATSNTYKFGSEKRGTAVELSAIDFYNQFGLIVFDECQKYCNNFAARAFKHAQAPYMLGLSATPDENANGWDNIAMWEIGPVLTAAYLPGYKETKTNFRATVHRIMYYGPPEYTRQIINNFYKADGSAGITDNTSTISMILQDEARNKLIVNCVLECLKDEKLFTYVFADRRECLEKYRIMLRAAINYDAPIVTDDDEFTRLVGGASMEATAIAEAKSRVILTTYQYGAVGRSIVKMNALVFAVPRRSGMKQTVGRILRLGSDETVERQIYDIVDLKLKLKNQWSSRLKYYKSREFRVVEEKHTYETANALLPDGIVSVYTRPAVVNTRNTGRTRTTNTNTDKTTDRTTYTATGRPAAKSSTAPKSLVRTVKTAAETIPNPAEDKKKYSAAVTAMKKIDYSKLTASIMNKLQD